jgi:hypothetical protein
VLKVTTIWAAEWDLKQLTIFYSETLDLAECTFLIIFYLMPLTDRFEPSYIGSSANFSTCCATPIEQHILDTYAGKQ